ncbi:MAG: SDR family oxidoreductase [Thermodesulfobacteriota bacterium]
MDVVLVGGTGLLGKSLAAHFTESGDTVHTIARRNADIRLDVRNLAALRDATNGLSPDVVINAAAVVDLSACEKDPGFAYAVNARPVSALAELSMERGWPLVHISTDHFFTGDGDKCHDERAAVRLMNEYARTKYAAEAYALTAEKSMVVRTNIVGFRDGEGAPTFMDWLVDSLRRKTAITLFDDYYTSSIDTVMFAVLLRRLIQSGTTGIINLGARQPASKLEFAKQVTMKMNLDLSAVKTGSIRSMTNPQRAESLGLDCRRAEKILGAPMPDLDEIAENLARQYKEKPR